MYKFVTQFLTLSCLALTIVSNAEAQFRVAPPENQTQQGASEKYSESALRRFEIITLSSLPFTAVHSYAIVRGIKMYTENQFAPELSVADYRVIGIGAVSLSLFIGLWDWFHTRKVDRAAPRIPERTKPPLPEEEEPIEGPIARLSNTAPYAAKYRGGSLEGSIDKALNRWTNEPAAGFAISFIQIRF